MSKSGYRTLEVWHEARLLTAQIYRVTADFPRHELFGLVTQMRRAAISVACNIAEGHGRRTSADRIQFIVIARGSLLEIETQAVLASDLAFMPVTTADEIVARSTEIARMLNGLIRYYMKPRK